MEDDLKYFQFCLSIFFLVKLKASCMPKISFLGALKVGFVCGGDYCDYDYYCDCYGGKTKSSQTSSGRIWIGFGWIFTINIHSIIIFVQNKTIFEMLCIVAWGWNFLKLWTIMLKYSSGNYVLEQHSKCVIGKETDVFFLSNFT